MPGAAEGEATFEHGDRVGEVSLAEGQHAGALIGHGQAVGGLACLGDPYSRLRPEGAGGKGPHLGQAHEQPGMGVHREERDMAEPLLAARVGQGRDTVLKHLLRPPIVAQVVVDRPQLSVRQSLERDIAKGHSERQRPLACRQGLVIVAYPLEMIGDIAGDLGQLTVIPAASARRSASHRTSRTRCCASHVAEPHQRMAQVEPQRDGVLAACHGPRADAAGPSVPAQTT